MTGGGFDRALRTDAWPSTNSNGPDPETLASYFTALSNRNRLELILTLREPRRLDDIRLSPTPSRAGGRPDRIISRQAVQNHLDLLMDLGLVHLQIQKSRGQRSALYYQTDYARLYAILEQIRKLLANPPGYVATTLTDDAALWDDVWRGPRHEPPHLTIVGGIQRGRTFPLRLADLSGERGWIIGRDSAAHIHLPHDPYVCMENAEILTDGHGHRLLDMRSCHNGTMRNWERLDPGESSALQHGDIIGVGRTLMVFRTT